MAILIPFQLPPVGNAFNNIVKINLDFINEEFNKFNDGTSIWDNVFGVNLQAGESGTAGTITIFPSTASKGKTTLTMADNSGDTTTAIIMAAQAAARTYTLPDAGASAASFVMTEGSQTIVGITTFSADLLFSTDAVSDIGSSTVGAAGIWGEGINAGNSGRAGTFTVFPGTASKGKTTLVTTDNTDDTTTALVVAAQAAARTYTIPDTGASTASFVMTQGAQTITGPLILSSVLTGAVGDAGAPGYTFSNDPNSGMHWVSADRIALGVNSAISIDIGTAQIIYSISGTQEFHMTATAFRPETDNTNTCGASGKRWSDVISTLINGADYGFANGWFLREYPATFKDIQTRSNDWLKTNTNKGIQLVNDRGEVVAVFGDDGTFYAKQIKTLNELDSVIRDKNITSEEDKIYEIDRRKEIKGEE